MENQTISSISMLITVNLSFNLISLVVDIIAILICLTILFIVIYRLIQIKCNRGRTPINVSIMLSINTLCHIIIKSILQLIHINVPTLMKDFQIVTNYKETIFYKVRAYILWSMIGVLYWSYVLLAFFRFIRIIYPTKLWLHRSSFYLYVLIPGQFILVFISMLPLLLIFDSIHLLPNEAYCSILIKPFYLLIYQAVINFSIPYIIICIFYIWINQKIKQTSVIRPYQERNRRDFVVMRRMLLNTVILCIVAIPYFIIYIYNTIHDDFDSLLYRVQWLSSSLSSFLFSIILPLIITQLRDLLKSNRLAPTHHRT